MAGLVARKLERIRAGGPPRVLDLFGGCGGFSLGFLRAGFEITAGVEFDPLAARSHALNFFRDVAPSMREAHALARDITTTEPEHLMAETGHCGRATDAVDVIIGGPPCQAFARVGRAKLREVAAHPRAFKQDPRGNLYLRFLEYIRQLRPLAIVMENVPDVMNYGGHNVAEETCEVLGDMGYTASYTLLNSAFYGVPQMRERMFLIAHARELEMPVRFPEPTHHIELPRGYEGSRQVAFKYLQQADLLPVQPSPDRFFVDPPEPDRCLPKAVTARDALEDLAHVTIHLEGKLRRGARRFDQRVAYGRVAKPGSYSALMRKWPGFEASPEGVADHVIRSLPRDYAIFERMKPGDQYPEAHAIARAMLRVRLEQEERSTGRRIAPGSTRYRQLEEEIVPPYDVTKFPNKWRKMEADQPARTLMAHLGKDGYSHIHYDSAQARTISVREAARLQSFPDGFVFAGTMNPAFRQIGNAVPPMLAKAVATVILDALHHNRL